MNRTIFCIIICCLCIFTCKPKEEIKKTGNIDKPLNLSLLFLDGGVRIVTHDIIDGKEIGTFQYPYSIDIINDSIIFTARRFSKIDEEYRGKLTDEQQLKIKEMVSTLNHEYKIQQRRVYDVWTCVLEIDNTVRYEHIACASNPEFTIPNLSPMPKEILLLFRYIVDLSPIRIMGFKPSNSQMKNNSDTTIAHQKGTFTDKRDGKTYKTTKISEQVWLAENLNYEMKSFFGLFTIGNKCYDNKPANCDKYGRLYNWNTAMKACPNGWHLPSKAEWDVLINTIGLYSIAGKFLKSTSGWNDYEGESSNGDDRYDFSALPGGYRHSDGDFNKVGSYGLWWSATEYGRGSYGIVIPRHIEIVDYDHYEKNYLFSVRCLQD